MAKLPPHIRSKIQAIIEVKPRNRDAISPRVRMQQTAEIVEWIIKNTDAHTAG